MLTTPDLSCAHGIACPACRGDSVHVSSVSDREATQHFVLREEDPERHEALTRHIGRLWERDVCEIRKCVDCGFGFANPFVAGDALFYNLAYPRVNYPATKWEYQATLDLIMNRTRLCSGNVLDVGAGFGFFLDMIRPHLAEDQECFAIEYNDEAAGVLRRKGYSVVQDDLRSNRFNEYGGAFAYLFLFQVVEHMDGLERLFDRIRYLLAEDGFAFIAVPNTFRTDFQEKSGSLIEMPPNHIGRWTEASFLAMANNAGLRIASSRIEPFSFIEFAKIDLKYYHLKRSHLRGSLANRIRRLPASQVRRLMEAALALSCAPIRIPTFLKAARSTGPLGYSMLIELTR